ncbi:ABC transporter substrate-binding protein [Brevibacillus fluminis]|uniref:ABC transporter substrate-binding protein n=1 Tax=Brevibacillus fluminis TaxID=511487 RepID=A0A3M8DJA1_9BACL|nr:ABC transporter substrate-binding protein [Brevibacillus fluminis]RNB87689.1 ABC transporter substrate-binding protein [Brevibacillus fluminis]
MQSRKLTKTLAVVILSLLLLTACSSNQTATNSTPGSEQTADKPGFGGTLRIGMTADPDTLNPLVSNTTPGNWVNSLIYPHLMTMNIEGNKVPDIADSVQVSNDGKLVTFKLRSGLHWQDGQPLTSADVKFTGEYLVKHKLQWTSEIFDQVESVETPDELTVTYKLKQPYPSFVGTVGYWIRIVPKHIWEKVSDPKNFDNKEPIGAGPFAFVKWEKGQYVELKAANEWFSAPERRPYLDKVIFKIYPDINTMVLALQADEIDVTAQDIPMSAVRQLETNEAIQIVQTPSLGYAYYSFNLNPKRAPLPTQDKNFRLAMAMATDKKTIINVGLEGAGIDIDTPISPVFADWVNPKAKAPAYDVAKAKELLAKAGYKDSDGNGIINAPEQYGGKDVELKLMYDSANAFHQKIAKILVKNASEISVKLVPVPVEFNTLNSKIFNEKDFEMHIGRWGVLDEQSELMQSLFDSEASLNFTGLKSQELDNIVRAAKFAPTKEKSREKVFAAQEWFVTEFPVVPIYVQKFNLAYNSEKFDGFKLYPSDLQGLVDPDSLASVYQKKQR